MLRAILVAILAVRLLVDMATPLMPGAFRFDPAESVEAHRTHSARAAHDTLVRPEALPQMGASEIVAPRIEAAPRTTVDARPPRHRPLLARLIVASSPEAAEDH